MTTCSVLSWHRRTSYSDAYSVELYLRAASVWSHEDHLVITPEPDLLLISILSSEDESKDLECCYPRSRRGAMDSVRPHATS